LITGSLNWLASCGTAGACLAPGPARRRDRPRSHLRRRALPGYPLPGNMAAGLGVKRERRGERRAAPPV